MYAFVKPIIARHDVARAGYDDAGFAHRKSRADVVCVCVVCVLSRGSSWSTRSVAVDVALTNGINSTRSQKTKARVTRESPPWHYWHYCSGVRKRNVCHPAEESSMRGQQ